jgi:glycine hydroxymethyltransferase
VIPHLDPTDPLAADEEVFKLARDELARQRTNIQLIASENFASPAVLQAASTVFTNKYSEGYPGRRYYGGNYVVDEVEALAIERAKRLFGADHVNVQPHSGASANLAVYLGLLEPGDTVLAMSLDQGGHLTHGAPVSFTGKLFRFVHYGVTPENDDKGERIDLARVWELAQRERPRMIVAGTSAYTRQINPKPFREIADDVGAYFVFDAAHPMGLIAAGLHPSPVGIADVVTFTTHKTLRGPRSGAIIARADLAKRIDSAVFPGLQGGPLEHIVAAKAVAFHEAAQPYFVGYCRQVIANASALADELKSLGFRLVSGGTENHTVLVDLRSFSAELSGKDAQEWLDRAGITCNRNQIPNDPRPPFSSSGLRLGTAAETTAGMKEEQMRLIARLIARVLSSKGDEGEIARVRSEVRELRASFDPYPPTGTWPGYCF